MSTLKADAVTAQSTNGDLVISGNGTGVPDIEAGFKVDGTVGVPTASIRDDAVTTAKIVDDAVTLAKMASGTDGVVITYDASGNPTHVGPGSDGEVLTSTGAGSPPAFEAAAAGGAWNIIDTEVASGSSSVTLTGISSTYASYVIKCSGVRLSSDGQDVRFQVGNSGGIITSGDYGYTFVSTSAPSATPAGTQNNGTSDHIRLDGAGVGGETTEGFSSTIEINTAIDTNAAISIMYRSFVLDTSREPFQNHGGGWVDTVIGQVTQCKIFPGSGNFTNGRFTLWGLAHA